jgi:hypothetical protein
MNADLSAEVVKCQMRWKYEHNYPKQDSCGLFHSAISAFTWRDQKTMRNLSEELVIQP